jgi:hypothetical protein
MKPLVAKIKPSKGFSHVLHLTLVVLLPIMVFVLVRVEFVQLAFSVVLLSKWRMLAVRPRFWPANIRANSVDIMVGLSIVVFMSHTDSAMLQLVFAALYAVWLLVIKPASNMVMISAQAFVGQLCGLMALFLAWSAGPLYGLVLLTGIICYVSARHYFDSFDEPYAKLLAYIWGYFGAALIWLLGHWLLFYGVVSQPTVILSTVGYGLAALYYFDHTGKLSVSLRRQFIFIMLAILVVILAFSDWGDKVL